MKSKITKVKGMSDKIKCDENLYDDICPVCNKEIGLLDIYVYCVKTEIFESHKEKSYHFAHTKCLKD